VLPELRVKQLTFPVTVADQRTINIVAGVEKPIVFVDGTTLNMNIFVVHILAQRFLLTEDYLRNLGAICLHA
jgi:hypothetical protein